MYSLSARNKDHQIQEIESATNHVDILISLDSFSVMQSYNKIQSIAFKLIMRLGFIVILLCFIKSKILGSLLAKGKIFEFAYVSVDHN